MSASAVATFDQETPQAMSPPREERRVNVERLTVPLPLTLTVVGMAIAAAAGVWTIEAQVSVITTSLAYERQLSAEREETDKSIKAAEQKYLDQRFEALEAKIDAAGLRNANMGLAQALQQATRK